MVEGSHHNPLKVRYRMESIEGVRPSVWPLDRIALGPSVYGQVVDGAETLSGPHCMRRDRFSHGET